jgi:hypothetical protein
MGKIKKIEENILDIKERTQENIDREKLYDSEISPIIKQLINKCKEYKMPLYIKCEYGKKEFSTTSLLTKNFNPHPSMFALNAIGQCFCNDGFDIDKFLRWVIRQIKQEGQHGSMYMAMLGYKAETGEYDWNQAYHIISGLQPINKEKIYEKYC